jgi:hypothetical protein
MSMSTMPVMPASASAAAGFDNRDLPANHSHGQDPGQGFFDWNAISAPVLHTVTSKYDIGTGMDMTPDGGVKHPQPVPVSALQFQDQWLTVDPSLVDFNMEPQHTEEDLVQGTILGVSRRLLRSFVIHLFVMWRLRGWFVESCDWEN